MECLTLKKANCKNCYKCIRHCPVKAIRFSGNQAYIIQDECIMCGQCFVVCPQDAKQIVSEVGKVRVMLQSGAPVVASLAPSFIANYAGSGIEEMREALKKLGFYDAEETALGATMVKREYDRMVERKTGILSFPPAAHQSICLSAGIIRRCWDIWHQLCPLCRPTVPISSAAFPALKPYSLDLVWPKKKKPRNAAKWMPY